MDKELQRYYEAREAMTSSRAWQDLIEDAHLMLDATDSIAGISTVEQLHFRKGEISILNWLISLKDTSDKAYEGMKNETPE